jgi:hypothetical protein
MHPFTVNELILDLIGPPIVAAIWWLMSRGWAFGVQGGEVSERTRTRQKRRFVAVLIVLYCVSFGTSLYVRVFK